MSLHLRKLITYLSLLLLGGVFLGPLVTYATLTLDSTSITTDDTLKLKGGNVGVGNITPTSNLHVSGTLNVTATSTAAALSVSGASALTGALTLSNPSTNSLIYTNSTGVVTALASSTAGKILTASGTAPYFSWETTGSLTNLTLTGPSTNSVIYTGSAGLITALASSTAGKILTASGTAPYFSWETTGSLTNLTLTGPSTNSPIYLNSAGLITALASSTAGKVLMATSTAPYFSWETDATGGGSVSTLVADGSNEITVGSTTSALTVNIANAALSATQTINIGSGSTGATSTSINIGGGTGANTVNIATGATNAKTISIGTGAVQNTISIGHASATVSIGGNITLASSTDALTLNLGANTGRHTINIATGQASSTVKIGSSSSTIVINNFWTALPTSPVDGQEIVYQASVAKQIYWNLKYNSASSTWVKIGGPPLYDEATNCHYINSTAYVDGSPAVSTTVPLAMKANIEVYVYVRTTNTGQWSTNVAYSINGGAEVGMAETSPRANATHASVIAVRVPSVSLSANDSIKLRYKDDATGGNDVCDRRLFIDPIYVQ